MNDTVDKLLHEVSDISKNYELLYQKTGKKFNVFDIARISTKEVKICSVMCELLSPRGSHYQGSLFLKLFIKNVFNKYEEQKIEDDEIKYAKVHMEYGIEEKRRIDLVIKTGNHLIPIEVKIDAGDQVKQCFDYSKKAVNSKLYYLTKFADLPSPVSTQGLDKITENGKIVEYKGIKCISFAEDILNWLDECLMQSQIVQNAPIREVILQLISTIKEFTNQMEDEMKNDITALLMKSKNNFINAMKIGDSITDTRKELMKQLFKEIEGLVRTKENTATIVSNREHSNYEWAISCYYDDTTYPGICYKFYKISEKELQLTPDFDEIWVRIEIDRTLSIGYCCPEGEKYSSRIAGNMKPEVVKMYTGKEKKEKEGMVGKDWWIYIEDVSIDDNLYSCPDFKDLSEENIAYYDLFDEKKRRRYAEKCADKIVEFLQYKK
jgi:hypothetical protein